jgi:hypothetical protein
MLPPMPTAGWLSRPLARVASVLWVPIAAIYTVFLAVYAYGVIAGVLTAPMPDTVIQLLVYASIAIPAWFLVWALWSRPSWRIAITSAVIGGLLFVLLAGTLFGVLALAAGLLPLVSMAIRPERSADPLP